MLDIKVQFVNAKNFFSQQSTFLLGLVRFNLFNIFFGRFEGKAAAEDKGWIQSIQQKCMEISIAGMEKYSTFVLHFVSLPRNSF